MAVAAAAAAVAAAAVAAASAAVVASFSFSPSPFPLAPFASTLPSIWSLGLCVVLLFGFVTVCVLILLFDTLWLFDMFYLVWNVLICFFFAFNLSVRSVFLV